VLQHEPLQLAPRWHLPAFQDSGRFEVILANLKWNGNFAGTEGTNCNPSPSLDDEVWKIAGTAYDGDIQFTLH
jgi:hypothetical protein